MALSGGGLRPRMASIVNDLEEGGGEPSQPGRPGEPGGLDDGELVGVVR